MMGLSIYETVMVKKEKKDMNRLMEQHKNGKKERKKERKKEKKKERKK